EHLRRMHGGRDQPDALRRHAAVEQRPRVLVVGQGKAQLELRLAHARAAQCPLIPLRPSVLTIGAHMAVSPLISAVKSCGLPPITLELRLANTSRSSGELSPALSWRLSRMMTSRGVPAGASSPVQLVDTRSG